MHFCFSISQFFLKKSPQHVIVIIEKGATAHKGLTDYENGKATLNRPKYQGGFCYVKLLTKRKNECKQCQKEKTKGH